MPTEEGSGRRHSHDAFDFSCAPLCLSDGESVPNNDSSTENLRLLSSDQALEDLVTFYTYLNAQYPGNAGAPAVRWVTFGGSYSGSLSAWARLKFPQLFIGAFAASAPVQAQLDFSQYFEIVSTSLGPSVSASLAASTAAVETLLESDAGRQQLLADFNLCAPIVTDNDAMTFVSALTTPYAETVQYDDDSVRLMQFDIPTIQNLTASAASPMAALISVWNAYNSFTSVTNCTDIRSVSSLSMLRSPLKRRDDAVLISSFVVVRVAFAAAMSIRFSLSSKLELVEVGHGKPARSVQLQCTLPSTHATRCSWASACASDLDAVLMMLVVA